MLGKAGKDLLILALPVEPKPLHDKWDRTGAFGAIRARILLYHEAYYNKLGTPTQDLQVEYHPCKLHMLQSQQVLHGF